MKIERVVVIGAGTMGSGIAQWFTQQMCFVELIDANSAQLNLAQKNIHDSWNKLVEKEKLSSCQVNQMKKLLEFKDLNLASKNADLVIEAIVENLDIKVNLLKQIDSFFNKNTIFASNTSSFSISEMSRALYPERKKNFIGLHFFNPATIMKLVEVVVGDAATTTLCQEIYQWFNQHDKKPAICKDSPGFIVNRVARNFYGEPLRIVGIDDEKKYKEVDFILKEVGGFKMGPFELMDLIGIDVNYSVTTSVWNSYQQTPRFAPHSLQEKMVKEKRFGKKTKHGFYKYD